MNRTTAILLAIGILLAHSLGIHRDFQWNFAGPFDGAHLAYALGENAAAGHGWHLGETGPGLQAYPSPLWVGLAWLVQTMGWSVPPIAQMVGLISALLLVSASTRIANDRTAGVIPPVLLVLSGTVASGAVSGTEHMTLAFLLILAFVSFEKNHALILMVALTLMAMTRAEGLLLCGVWFLFWVFDRTKTEGQRSFGAWVFVPAALAGGFFCWYTPVGETHSLYGAVFNRLLGSEATEHGWNQLLDFTKIAISPAWMVIGLVFVLTKRFSAPGVRAFILATIHMLYIVRSGGEDLPFSIAFLPSLPLICIVIQEMTVAALDTYRPSLEGSSWALLLLTALGAASASKFPGEIGPLSLREPHAAWLQAHSPASLGQSTILGRTQLQAEIRRTSEMRRVAKFLEQHLDPETTVLSPWNGSLTYYLPNRILDWFSRLQSSSETPQRANLGYTAGAYLERAFAAKPDIVLPAIGLGATLGPSAFLEGLNPELLRFGGDSQEAKEKLTKELRDGYGMIALPITHPTTGRATPFFVYQNLERSGRPGLSIHGSAEALHVQANPPQGRRALLPQMVCLLIQATDSAGQTWIAQPSGRLVKTNKKQFSQAPTVLSTKTANGIRLWSGDLSNSPTGQPIQKVQAQLFLPRVDRRHPLAPVSEQVEWSAN
ncbi:MAG: hypothetical protein GY930_03045 [bacterium]|nr:hypothetical protein [bacterium]